MAYTIEPALPKKLEKADMEGENAGVTKVERIFTKKGERGYHQIA